MTSILTRILLWSARTHIARLNFPAYDNYVNKTVLLIVAKLNAVCRLYWEFEMRNELNPQAKTS